MLLPAHALAVSPAATRGWSPSFSLRRMQALMVANGGRRHALEYLVPWLALPGLCECASPSSRSGPGPQESMDLAQTCPLAPQAWASSEGPGGGALSSTAHWAEPHLCLLYSCWNHELGGLTTHQLWLPVDGALPKEENPGGWLLKAEVLGRMAWLQGAGAGEGASRPRSRLQELLSASHTVKAEAS